MHTDSALRFERHPIHTDVVIVGAGPCGLFQVFELGLLGLKAHVVDSLKAPGGQCVELYPDKPIYDIPAVPVCTGQELTDRLLEQIQPFGAGLHLGQEVTEVARQDNGRFRVATAAGTVFDAGAVVIAGGVGSFQPRRLDVPGAAELEGKYIHYRCKDPRAYADQDVVILGGGDSALDWALTLVEHARSIVLVHRRPEFRGAPASVAKLHALREQQRADVLIGHAKEVTAVDGRAEVAERAGRVTASCVAWSWISCWCSSVCIRSSGRSPTGAWTSTSVSSASTPRSFRRTCRASTRSATSITMRARKS